MKTILLVCCLGFVLVGLTYADCGEPPTLRDAYAEVYEDGPPYPTDTEAEYYCETDVLDMAFTTCRQDGTWTPVTINCGQSEAVACPALSPPAHGGMEALNPEATSYRFLCEDSHVIYGHRRLDCVDGQWSAEAPTCIPDWRTCGNPGTPTNGVKYGDNYKAGGRVQFACRPGYTLDGGDRVRVCKQDTFTWSGYQPYCREDRGILDVADHFKDVLESYAPQSSSSQLRKAMGKMSTTNPNGIDLVLMFDGSSSLSPTNFQTFINFSMAFLDVLGVANVTGGTKVCIITFGSNVTVALPFNQCADLECVKGKLKSIRQPMGGTAMVEALTKVKHLVPFLREGAEQAIFLFTDGHANKGQAPEKDAKELRKLRGFNFEIYSIGVGQEVNMTLMRLLASKPIVRHMFILDSYSDLKRIQDIILERRFDFEKCGIPDNFEGRKQKIKKGTWPWLANILEMDEEGEFSVRCGAALLCRNWVITAAQCVQNPKAGNNSEDALMRPDQLFVVLGSHKLSTSNWEVTQQLAVVEKIVVHPDYEAGDSSNDLALIKLDNSTSPVLNKYVRTICLRTNGSSAPDWQHVNDRHNKAWVVGWGITNATMSPDEELEMFSIARQMKVVIPGRKKCEEKMSDQLVTGGDRFCAGQSVSRACRGDIGGPLVRRASNDYFILIGIGVYNRGCNELSRYAVFTDVSKHLDWIHETTDGCNADYNIIE